MIVDSHCHVSTSWMLPLESLMFELDRAGVLHAVLVQLVGQYDNEYLFECARRFPGRFGVVVHVDANQPDAIETLKRLVERGVSGVRFQATTRSPGEDPFAIWRAAEQMGLSITTLGRGADFLADWFTRVMETITKAPIVIEHLGSSNFPEHDPMTLETRRQIFALARFPNAHIKIHGLGEFSRRASPRREPFPFEEPIEPLHELAYKAFGARRMMWGSDFPPVANREGYANALRFPMERLADKSGAERAEIFGGTALRLFPML